MRNVVILIGILLLSGASRGCAGLYGEEPVRQFTFQTFYYEGKVIERTVEGETINLGKLPQYFYQSAGEFKQLVLARDNLGLRQHFHGAGPFTIYRETKGEEHELVMVPVASLSTGHTPGGGHLLILLTPEEDELLVRAVRADTEESASNTLLLLNMTGYRLAAQIGEGTRGIILPGQSKAFRYATGKNSQFRLQIVTEGEDGWRLIRSTNITQVNPQPLFMIVHPDARREGQWQTRFLKISR